ncbi:hypothetical protein EJB05_33708, partial [Eragrostis curvula]
MVGEGSAKRRKRRRDEESDGEVFVEEKDEEVEGQSAGEDADGEEFIEESEDEGEEEISEEELLSEEEEEEGQSDGEDYESSGGGREEEDESEESASGGAGVNDEGSPDPITPPPPHARRRHGEHYAILQALSFKFKFWEDKIREKCKRGHVVCSACCDKLKATGKCHVCGVSTRGYSRCHAMEHLVVSICIPCPNAIHGCGAKPAYHNRDSHSRLCPHAPCRCPGASCGFIGSTAALLDHFATVHSWPCTVKAMPGEAFSIRLHDGFNFLRVDRAAVRDDQDAISSTPLIFLLNVTQERLGRAISMVRVDPHAVATSSKDNCGDDRPALLTSQCELIFSNYDHSNNGALCRRYYQSSEFQVACTDLSNGLPNPDLGFQLVVPNSVLGDKEGIQVKARIIIN